MDGALQPILVSLQIGLPSTGQTCECKIIPYKRCGANLGACLQLQGEMRKELWPDPGFTQSQYGSAECGQQYIDFEQNSTSLCDDDVLSLDAALTSSSGTKRARGAAFCAYNS